MTTAWNAGPGNLNKWSSKFSMAMIRCSSRAFLLRKHVYLCRERVPDELLDVRTRFRQPLKSLEAVASGKWPIYRSERSNGTELAGEMPLGGKVK